MCQIFDGVEVTDNMNNTNPKIKLCMWCGYELNQDLEDWTNICAPSCSEREKGRLKIYYHAKCYLQTTKHLADYNKGGFNE